MGRFSMDIVINWRMVMFWNSLIDNSGTLSSILYKHMLKIHKSSQADFKRIKYIKSICDENGLSFIWNDQIHIKKDLLKSIVKQRLFDQFIQTWFSQMNNSTRAELYGSFKKEFKLEPYRLRLIKSENIYEQIQVLNCYISHWNWKMGKYTSAWKNMSFLSWSYWKWISFSFCVQTWYTCYHTAMLCWIVICAMSSKILWEF